MSVLAAIAALAVDLTGVALILCDGARWTKRSVLGLGLIAAAALMVVAAS